MGDMADWQIDQFFMEDDGPTPCPECEGAGFKVHEDIPYPYDRSICPACNGDCYE